MKICTTLIEVSSEQWRSQFISIRSPAAVAAAAAAAAAALCVLLILLLLLQQQCCCFLLLFVIVSMAKFIADSLELMPAFSVSSFKCDFFFMVPLGSTVPHLRPRFAYILGNFGHARSQGGRQPAAENTLLYYIYTVSICMMHACGVRVVFLEHVALGVYKS